MIPQNIQLIHRTRNSALTQPSSFRINARASLQLCNLRVQLTALDSVETQKVSKTVCSPSPRIAPGLSRLQLYWTPALPLLLRPIGPVLSQPIPVLHSNLVGEQESESEPFSTAFPTVSPPTATRSPEEPSLPRRDSHSTLRHLLRFFAPSFLLVLFSPFVLPPSSISRLCVGLETRLGDVHHPIYTNLPLRQYWVSPPRSLSHCSNPSTFALQYSSLLSTFSVPSTFGTRPILPSRWLAPFPF
ncbi:hypothetical protein BDW68DRAFT_56177 [Aspergillus falconensis]